MTDRRVVAIIQARMGSSRLPGKVLLDIAGQPMLAHVVRRASLAQSVDHVVVATSTEPADAPIVEFCAVNEIEAFRGHPTDVLDRVYRAALAYEADVVVRITADCPLLDPDLVDTAVEELVEAGGEVDFVANRLPYDRTYPIGLDVEVCWMEGLERVWREAQEDHQREHVMPYFYENPDLFEMRLLHADEDYGSLRWTVDSSEDLEFVREVYREFQPRQDFGWREVLKLLQRKPELAAINSGVQHRSHTDVG